MQDVFSRIGLAMGHLLDNSTLVGAPKEEVKRLSEELKAFEAGIGTMISQIVDARTEALYGRLTALESRANDIASNQASTQAGLETLATTLEAAVETDTLVAGDGNDTILAGAGGDSLPGDAGADTLEGGGGADTLDAPLEEGSVSGDQPADVGVVEPAVTEEQPSAAEEPAAV